MTKTHKRKDGRQCREKGVRSNSHNIVQSVLSESTVKYFGSSSPESAQEGQKKRVGKEKSLKNAHERQKRSIEEKRR